MRPKSTHKSAGSSLDAQSKLPSWKASLSRRLKSAELAFAKLKWSFAKSNLIDGLLVSGYLLGSVGRQAGSALECLNLKCRLFVAATSCGNKSAAKGAAEPRILVGELAKEGIVGAAAAAIVGKQCVSCKLSYAIRVYHRRLTQFGQLAAVFAHLGPDLRRHSV